jgi:F-type H+-transporting ATPase subunit alpha
MKNRTPAPGIMDRTSVHEPLHTGTKVVDALIPIEEANANWSWVIETQEKLQLLLITIINLLPT